MNIIQRRFPNFVDGVETEHEFETLDELMAIDWIDRLAKHPGFHRFAICKDGSVFARQTRAKLIVELQGGKKWYIIGYFQHNNVDLPEWTKQ